MTYSIWLVPSRKDSKYLDKIIQSLAKKYDAPRFSAHITVYSGIASFASAKSAVQILFPRKIRARKIGIGKSDSIWKTLYIRIKKDKKLDKIYKTLKSILKTRYTFLPHISLIYKKLSNATKTKIIQALKTKKSFAFDGVAIIRSSKNIHQWKVLYRASLGTLIVKFSKSLRS